MTIQSRILSIAMRIFLFTSLILDARFSYAYSYQNLKDLIDANHFTNIENVLEKLPENFRSKYVMLFNSRSLQSASIENPRILIYGDDAKFIISFNGSKDQKGFYALETLEYDSFNKKFLLREISFPTDQSKSVSYSEINPQKCITCHGENIRPIWDTHPIWPGAYGEKYLSDLSKFEVLGLDKFKTIQAEHPRYKNLININRFYTKDTFNPSVKFLYSEALKDSPNEELSRYLSRYNSERIINQLSESSSFLNYQYLLLASISSDCGKIESFIPLEYRQEFNDKLIKFTSFSNEVNIEEYNFKNLRLSSPLETNNLIEKNVITNRLDNFRFIVENSLGVDTTDWTTALEVSTYDFTSPQLINNEIEKYIINQVEKKNSEFQKIASLKSFDSTGKYCRFLQKKSLESFKGDFFNKKLNYNYIHLKESPSTINLCIKCHTGVIGSFIPFNQPNVLTNLMNKEGYKRGKLIEEIIYRLSDAAGDESMPRGKKISESERQDLVNYFKKLSELNKK